ncbi:MAG: hypothetical protein ACR2MG_13825 [Pyrinomonadaceae bacterium]
MERRTLIGETIEFLREYSPEILEDLKVRFPEDSKIISLGTPAGDDIPLNFAVDATLGAMKTALEESEKHRKKIEENLKRAKKYKITAQVITIISNSSLFLLIANNWYNFGYVMNSLALVGVILPMITEYFTYTLHPENKDLFQLYIELIGLQSKAELIDRDLTLCKEAQYPELCNGIPTRDLVREGNVLSQQLRNILRQIGVQLTALSWRKK